MKEKMGIYQRYNLGPQHYHSYFEFDFKNKKAQLISQDITEDFRKDNALIYTDDSNLKIANSLLIAEENKIFDLNEDDCQKLYSEFDKIKYSHDEEIPGIWQLSNITFSEKNFYDDAPEIFKIHESNYQYVNNYPKNWIPLGNLIIDLLGFDLLNINLNNLITPLYYNITSEGVYEKQTNNKLNLKKLNFNIVSFEEPFNPFNFSIDSEDSDFEKIIELLEDYGVYKWYDKDYAENIIESDDFNDFKGNSWFIELIFENGRVLNLRGDNAYPDTYIHLGNEILNFKEDLLRINEIDKEQQNFIKSFGENKLAKKRNIIKKIEISQTILLDDRKHYEFTLDYENSVIIPYDNYDLYEPREHISRDLSKKNYSVSKLFYENIVKEEIKLDEQKLDNFLNEINELKFIDEKPHMWFYDKNYYQNLITIHTPMGEKSYNLTNNYELWKKLCSLFEELLGFDVLNIKNFKNIINPFDYDICNDGVYDKETGDKLSLEYIEYGHEAVLHFGIGYNIYVDLLKGTTSGLIEKDDLSNDEIEKIVSLLEKNRVYEWVFDEFWNKAIYHKWCGFDGYNWYLSLVFEGNKVLNIGDGNDYPDTFVNLAEEVIEFSGKDILKLKTVYEDDIKIYKKYAELHLNG